MNIPRWGIYALSVVGGVVVGTAGFKIYKAYEDKKKVQNAPPPPAKPGREAPTMPPPPAVVNWIPGCAYPAGWEPPAGWTLGSVPPLNAIKDWVAPIGWTVGSPLPPGFPCPPGWVKTGDDTPLFTEETYVAKNGVAWTLRRTLAIGSTPEAWAGYRPSLGETIDSKMVVSSSRGDLVKAIESAFGSSATKAGDGSSASTSTTLTGRAVVMGPGGRPRFVAPQRTSRGNTKIG